MTDTTPTDTAPDPAAEPAPRRRFPVRPLLIGAVAGVAVLGLGVGAFALAGAFDVDDRIVIASEIDAASTDDAVQVICVDDDGEPVNPDDFAEVTAVALEAAGGGTVTEVSRDDDPGKAWEVEIRRDNGDEVEVELDGDLNVVRIDLDRPSVVVVQTPGSDEEVIHLEVHDVDC